ncbi:MAG: hypothetical protein IKJ01_00465 [Lachnospiraceae bacterium]|nr:hypothetical protein [Lachnospiraceae bacterium]
MKRRWKQELKKYYQVQVPKPKRKRQFIQQIGLQKQHYGEIVLLQCRYISKSVWITSIAFFAVALFCCKYIEAIKIGAIAAGVPILVAISITDTMRSFRYGMGELEATARFSLKSIILMRMLMIGFVNIGFLLLLAIQLGNGMWANTMFLMVPYLLSASMSLAISRHTKNRIGNYTEIVVSIFIIGVTTYINRIYSFLYEQRFVPIWTILCILLLGITIREVYRTIQRTGEFVWS